MQTLVQTRCSKGPSLRRRIGDDPRLGRFDLEVVWEKKPGRPHGWAKLRSTRDARGAKSGSPIALRQGATVMRAAREMQTS